jgi:hypothetical protein
MWEVPSCTNKSATGCDPHTLAKALPPSSEDNKHSELADVYDTD